MALSIGLEKRKKKKNAGGEYSWFYKSISHSSHVLGEPGDGTMNAYRAADNGFQTPFLLPGNIFSTGRRSGIMELE
jgi:hypothetical protein